MSQFSSSGGLAMSLMVKLRVGSRHAWRYVSRCRSSCAADSAEHHAPIAIDQGFMPMLACWPMAPGEHFRDGLARGRQDTRRVYECVDDPLATCPAVWDGACVVGALCADGSLQAPANRAAVCRGRCDHHGPTAPSGIGGSHGVDSVDQEDHLVLHFLASFVQQRLDARR
eukprot:6950320-Prymnesium_polylepis.2